MHDYDALSRRTVFRNATNVSHAVDLKHAGKVILRASAMTIDFESEAKPFHMTHLGGRWVLDTRSMLSPLQSLLP